MRIQQTRRSKGLGLRGIAVPRSSYAITFSEATLGEANNWGTRAWGAALNQMMVFHSLALLVVLQ